MISSIMPMPKNPLCSNTGKRITKVDRVLLLVCAKLSTWMAAQGNSADCSPLRQKPVRIVPAVLGVFFTKKGGTQKRRRQRGVPQDLVHLGTNFTKMIFSLFLDGDRLPISNEQGFFFH